MTSDKDKATAKRIIKRYLDNDTNDYQLENEFIAALITARREAREAAFRECAGIATAMATGETCETGRQKALNIAAAIKAAANTDQLKRGHQ